MFIMVTNGMSDIISKYSLFHIYPFPRYNILIPVFALTHLTVTSKTGLRQVKIMKEFA